MSAPPRRLIDSAQTRAERQVALAASVPARAARLDGWDDILSRAATTRPRIPLASTFIVSFFLGAGLMLALQPAAAPPGQTPQFQVAPGAKWASASAQEIELSSGRLWMNSASDVQLRVRTPHGVLEIRQSRFLAEVTTNGTSVTVDEGEVVFRAGPELRRVATGQTLSWPPAPDISPSLLERALEFESFCSGVEGAAQRACLEQQTRGEGLRAEVSLYELGLLAARERRSDEAVRVWRESISRFPSGVLHPEVRLALLVELVKARRFDEARTEARAFQVHCADDPRSPGVTSLLNELR